MESFSLMYEGQGMHEVHIMVRVNRRQSAHHRGMMVGGGEKNTLIHRAPDP